MQNVSFEEAVIKKFSRMRPVLPKIADVREEIQTTQSGIDEVHTELPRLSRLQQMHQNKEFEKIKPLVPKLWKQLEEVIAAGKAHLKNFDAIPELVNDFKTWNRPDARGQKSDEPDLPGRTLHTIYEMRRYTELSDEELIALTRELWIDSKDFEYFMVPFGDYLWHADLIHVIPEEELVASSPTDVAPGERHCHVYDQMYARYCLDHILRECGELLSFSKDIIEFGQESIEEGNRQSPAGDIMRMLDESDAFLDKLKKWSHPWRHHESGQLDDEGVRVQLVDAYRYYKDLDKVAMEYENFHADLKNENTSEYKILKNKLPHGALITRIHRLKLSDVTDPPQAERQQEHFKRNEVLEKVRQGIALDHLSEMQECATDLNDFLQTFEDLYFDGNKERPPDCDGAKEHRDHFMSLKDKLDDAKRVLDVHFALDGLEETVSRVNQVADAAIYKFFQVCLRVRLELALIAFDQKCDTETSSKLQSQFKYVKKWSQEPEYLPVSADLQEAMDRVSLALEFRAPHSLGSPDSPPQSPPPPRITVARRPTENPFLAFNRTFNQTVGSKFQGNQSASSSHYRSNSATKSTIIDEDCDLSLVYQAYSELALFVDRGIHLHGYDHQRKVKELNEIKKNAWPYLMRYLLEEGREGEVDVGSLNAVKGIAIRDLGVPDQVFAMEQGWKYEEEIRANLSDPALYYGGGATFLNKNVLDNIIFKLKRYGRFAEILEAPLPGDRLGKLWPPFAKSAQRQVDAMVTFRSIIGKNPTQKTRNMKLQELTDSGVCEPIIAKAKELTDPSRRGAVVTLESQQPLSAQQRKDETKRVSDMLEFSVKISQALTKAQNAIDIGEWPLETHRKLLSDLVEEGRFKKYDDVESVLTDAVILISKIESCDQLGQLKASIGKLPEKMTETKSKLSQGLDVDPDNVGEILEMIKKCNLGAGRGQKSGSESEGGDGFHEGDFEVAVAIDFDNLGRTYAALCKLVAQQLLHEREHQVPENLRLGLQGVSKTLYSAGNGRRNSDEISLANTHHSYATDVLKDPHAVRDMIVRQMDRKEAELEGIILDCEDRPYNWGLVVVNFNNVGRMRKAQREEKRQSAFSWDDILICIEYLVKNNVKVIGVIQQNYTGFFRGKKVYGVPPEIKRLCLDVDEVARTYKRIGDGYCQDPDYNDMDDKVCIEYAKERNCMIMDNDRYGDWLETGRGHAGKGGAGDLALARDVLNWFRSSYHKVKVSFHIHSHGGFTCDLEDIRSRNRGQSVITGKDGFQDASPAGGGPPLSSSSLMPPNAYPSASSASASSASRWTKKTNKRGGVAGRALTPITEASVAGSRSTSVSPQQSPVARPMFGNRSRSSSPPGSSAAPSFGSPAGTPSASASSASAKSKAKTKGKTKNKNLPVMPEIAEKVVLPSPNKEDEIGDW